MNSVPWHIYEFGPVDSTQNEARQLAESETGIFAVSASIQKAGRGQHGRIWHSPAGENILTTIAVPARVVKAPEVLALGTGCAIARCLSAYLTGVRCRWPNDIYIGDKKISGILIEYSREWYFTGIGCNVNWPDRLPSQHQADWTSIAAETGHRRNCSTIMARIYMSFAHMLEQTAEEILQEYASHWEEKGCAADVLVHGEWIRCRLCGINRNGTLAAVDAAGTELTITSSATLRRIHE